MPNDKNQTNNRSSGSTWRSSQNNTNQQKPKKVLPSNSKSENPHQITQDSGTKNPPKSNSSKNAPTFKSKQIIPQLENQNQNQVIKTTLQIKEPEEIPTTSKFTSAQENLVTRSGTSFQHFEPVLENVYKSSVLLNTKSKSAPNIKYKSSSKHNVHNTHTHVKTFASESNLASAHQAGFVDLFSHPITHQRYSSSSISTTYYSDDDQDRNREASESHGEEQEQEGGGGSSQTCTRKIHRRPKRAVSRSRRKEKQKTAPHEFDRQKEIQLMEKEVREELAKIDKGKEEISSIPGVRELLRVEKAIKEGHVFELKGGVMNGSAVRDTFLKRGWVQKKELSKQLSKQLSTISQTSQNKNGSKTGTTPGSIESSCWSLAQRLLSRHPPNLIWAAWVGAVSWSTVYDWQIINHQRGESFTLKKNLIRPIQNLHWYGAESPSQTCTSAFLRTYRLFDDDEKVAFVQDYRLTCCISLLKWFVLCMHDKNGTSKNHIPTLSNEPSIETSTLLTLLNFALRVVKQYVRVRRHEDIDEEDDDDNREDGTENEASLKIDIDWPTYFTQVQKITRRNIKFLDVSTTSTMSTATSTGKESHQREKEEESQREQNVLNVQGIYLEAKASLKDLKPFWPHLNIDGFLNVWIFKPGSGMRGQGISVHDKYKTIAHKFLMKDTSKSTWLAQKYIERPLLIFKTKFDIRQWILITSCNPLVVWIYKQCYIRFSGKLYTLDDMNESIHLTNQAVQYRYKTDPARDPALPSNNMWTLETFQGYLKKINKPNIWKKMIYPQIKKIIITVLLATRESIENRPASFHLQGCDFMLAEDFRPWLIEINPNPMFASTTSVTARLCQQCIRDTTKVVLDWKGDGSSTPKNSKKVDTGDWELLFHSKVPLATPSTKMDGSEETLIQCTKVPTVDSTFVQETKEFENEGHRISRKATRHFIPWTTNENDPENWDGANAVDTDADDDEIMQLN